MTTIVLPDFSPDLPPTQVDASLRQALAACDRARECALLWFAEVQRRGLYRALGHASLQLYATESLGFSDNRYWQFKRLADDLDRLPVLKEAVASGDLGWTKAQQVARVATAETQTEWVAKATECGRRELAAAVQVARKAEPASAVPVTISLRADGLQLARFEALIEKAHKLGLVPTGTDRMEVILEALDALVTGTGEPNQGPAAQIVVHRCPDCERAAVVTSRGEQELAPAQVAALACDAKVQEPGKPNRATIPPKVRAAVLARDRHRCTTPGCRATRFLEVHHVVPRSRGGTNRAENLVTLCGRCHAFAHAQGELAPAQVATAPG